MAWCRKRLVSVLILALDLERIALSPAHWLDREALKVVVGGARDGYIAFATKPDPEGPIREAFNFPVELLDQLPLDLGHKASDSLRVDGYYAPTIMLTHGNGRKVWQRRKLAPEFDHLMAPRRDRKVARWLTCCWTDLDVYNAGITVGQALGAVTDAADRGEIPWPSILAMSGRGIWVFFLLRGEDENGEAIDCERAWPENVTWHWKINDSLAHKFSQLGADAKSTDVARLTRIPGSQNGKSGETVRYLIFAENGKLARADMIGKLQVDPIRYTLSELGESLGIPHPQSTINRGKNRKMVRTRSKAKLAKAETARWRWILQSLDLLETIRGGFPEGTRHHAIIVKAFCLGRLNKLLNKGYDIEALCLETAQNCSPPMDDKDLIETIKKGERGEIGTALPNFQGYALSYQTVSRWMRVTPHEELLLTEALDRKVLSYAPREQEPGTKTQPEQVREAERRRALILQLASTLDRIPTDKEILELVAFSGLEPICQQKASQDIALLNSRGDLSAYTPRKKKRRRSQQTTLAFPG